MTMKPTILTAALISVVLAAGVIVMHGKRSTPSFDDPGRELQFLVSDLVAKDRTVKNCVLSVEKGDGSFSWTGAAGVARQDGRVPMAADTPFYIASITKLYTATAVMLLHEQGRLSLDDPMARYFPEGLIRGIHVYEGRDLSGEVTIAQLLSHTSGIADYYTEAPQGGKSLFETFLDDPQRTWTVDETIEGARGGLEPHFQPGTGAFYSDTNYQLLGRVIESVTGRPLHEVFEEFFFRPLDLRHTWLVGRSEPLIPPAAPTAEAFSGERNITEVRSNGSYWADGGIVSTARDGIAFLKALREGRLIREDTLRLMHDWHKLEFPMHYGFGTMYFSLPRYMRSVMNVPPVWGHSGSIGSFLYYSEDLDLYVAGTVNQTESKTRPFRLMGKAVTALQRGDGGETR